MAALEPRVRVLLVGHFFVNHLNRRKLDRMVEDPCLDLHLLIPSRWLGSLGELYDTSNERDPKSYKIYPQRTFLGGRNRMQLYVFGPGVIPDFRAIDPDIVHVEEEPYSAIAFQMCLLNQTHRRRPFLLTTYQNIFKPYPPPFCWTQRYVLDRTTLGLGGTVRSQELLREKGFQGPVELLPYGVDTDLFRPGDARDIKEILGLTGRVVGYLGRLVTVKGLHTLMESFSTLPEDVSLLFIGSGPLGPELEGLARERGFRHRFLLLEGVGHEKVPDYLRVMDCLVLPSITTPESREQFGRVLIEAMACGVPVVGSTSGEIPEVIGDAGLVFPEGDTMALTGALTRILSDPATREDFKEKGRRRIREVYSIEAVARRNLEIYRKVHAEQGTGRVPGL